MVKNNNFFIVSVLTFCYFTIIYSIIFLVPYGNDILNYHKIFNGLGEERIEIGFLGLIGLVKIYGVNEIITFWTLTMVTLLYIKLYVVYKINKKNIFIFLLIYTVSYFLLHESLQLRIAIGFSVLILSIYFLSLNRLLMSCVLFVVAALFHNSILIFLLIYFLYYAIKKRFEFKFLLIAGLITIGSSVFIESILAVMANINPLIIDYYNLSLELEKFNYFSITQLLIYSFIFIGYFNYFDASSFGKIIYMQIIVLLYAIFLFSFIYTIAIRLSDLIGILAIFYLIDLKINFSIKKITLLLSVILIALHKYVSFIYIFPIFKF